MLRKHHYILDESKNVIPATILEWAEFLENEHSKIVVKQENVNSYFVSTVFLGLDHNFEELCADLENYKPLIFETMIFYPRRRGFEEYCDRYSTWQEAEEGHKKAVEWAKNQCLEDKGNE